MGNKILICGLNGAGKSTLGKRLAQELGWKFMDIEAYFFKENNIDYDDTAARTKEEAAALLLDDMKKYDNFVLAAVKGDYGEEIASLLTCAVLVSAPKGIRMQRVRERM